MFRRLHPRLIPAGLFCVFSLLATIVEARDWHVSPKGNDSNSGEAASRPFRSLQKAADRAEPGDTVFLGEGVYPAPEDSDINTNALVTLSKTGRPDAWITFKAAPGAKPELRPLGWNGIFVTGSYYVLDGLAITGANDSIRLIDAIKEEKNPKPNPYYNTNGISIDGRKNPP
ncbi:MAG: hypothetical protein H7067_09460, partial [Burkholderiales bacterium]|nr:hypothetical protein [Opitutaceae bacterium]